MLTREQARTFYDRLGRGQDRQAFYEEPALRELIAQGDFGRSRAVIEFGCGTGRLAAGLLSRHLSPQARYQGIDLSATMIRLATERLRPWADRARVDQSDGAMRLNHPDGAFDRFLSTYVLDLLPLEDIATLLGEAHRVLEPAGLLCLASLAPGPGWFTGLVSGAWKAVHALNPALVGGCRPLQVAGLLPQEHWTLRVRRLLVAWGLTSEVVVVERR